MLASLEFISWKVFTKNNTEISEKSEPEPIAYKEVINFDIFIGNFWSCEENTYTQIFHELFLNMKYKILSHRTNLMARELNEF